MNCLYPTNSVHSDETFLWPAKNILVQQLNHAATYLSSACQHHAEITQSHTFAALIFSHQLWVKVHLQFCSRLINLTLKSLLLRPTYFLVTKQYLTFLCQPGSGSLIRLAKWNENTIRYWTMQTLRIVLPLSHFYMMLPGKRCSRWPITKCKLLNGTETSFRRALISNN